MGSTTLMAVRDRAAWRRARQGTAAALAVAVPLPGPSRPDSRLFSLDQRLRLKGAHARHGQPTPGKLYVGGVAFPQSPRQAWEHGVLLSLRRAVTVTIAEVDGPGAAVRIVQHLQWTFPLDSPTLRRLGRLLAGEWRCRRVLAEGDASALAGVVEGVVVAPPRSTLGLTLLASVDAGRLAMYAEDGSPEHREFWAQAVRARCRRGNGPGLEFYVEPSTGDDGFLVGLALVAQAATVLAPAVSVGG